MIEIQINTDAVQQALDRAADKLAHRELLMRVVAARLRRAVYDNFNAQDRPAWAGIKRHCRILQDNGHLRKSITEQSNNDNAAAL